MLIDKSIKEVIEVEIRGLQELKNCISDTFIQTIELLLKVEGRVIITGMGKNSHVARKITSTLASTGAPAQFIHPSEASHGDLGMMTKRDILIAISWSGETTELYNVIKFAQKLNIKIIAITSKKESSLAQASDVLLLLPQVDEACPYNIVPTTSTTITMVIGDAIAVALLKYRGFTMDEFHHLHPGGKLGSLLKTVSEVMHTGVRLPLAPYNLKVSEAIILMTNKGFGCLGIQNEQLQLVGVITDGDLRRHMGVDMLSLKAEDIMTVNPKIISNKTFALEALKRMNEENITSMFILDENNRPTGLVHIHDLLRL